MDSPSVDLAHDVARQLDGRSVACAESLTAGRVASALAMVDGAVDFLRGGVVAYQPAVKASLLGVTADSVLSLAAAEQMARGAARLLEADVAVATTGLAGGEPQDGVDVGTVFIAASGPFLDEPAGTHCEPVVFEPPRGLTARATGPFETVMRRTLQGLPDADRATTVLELDACRVRDQRARVGVLGDARERQLHESVPSTAVGSASGPSWGSGTTTTGHLLRSAHRWTDARPVGIPPAQSLAQAWATC